MGLQTTASSSASPLVLNVSIQESTTAAVRLVKTVPSVHLSFTNVSTHGHGNMAPALTEPLSQTNKLSSSATSASPRPSSNNLISESDSATVATSIGNFPESNHINNSIVSDNSTRSSDSHSPSFASGANNKINSDSFPSSDNKKNGTFQSAFEQFQQTRQQQQQDDSPSKTTRKSCSKLPLTQHQKSIETSPINGRLSNGQMGPMCDTNIKFHEHNNIEDSIDEEEDIVEKQELCVGDQREDDVEIQIQHMDYSNCDEIIDIDNQDEPPRLQSANNNNNKEVQEDMQVVEDDGVDEDEEEGVVCDIECEKDEQQSIEIIQDDTIPTDAVNTSECDNPNPQIQTLEVKEKTPPRTPPPNGANQNLSQHTPTSSTVLTPQTTPSGMGLQKDFIKDTAEMEQVLGELGTSDMDLLQVLKGFDTTPGSEGAFCELSLFTDVDVMNYEEVGIQQPKDAETREVRNEIEKRQQQMQRKCDFLVRRLRKIQARFESKHTSEEIAGLFEWQANPTLRRKDHDSGRSASSYEDKRRQISTVAMKSFVRRINTAAEQQHSSLVVRRNKVGRPSNASLQAEVSGSQGKTTPVASIVPPINEKMVEEIAHVSGHLHTELKEIKAALDSDATASSSGGDSADEMQLFNNTVQQPLSISKRASWRWSRDRAGIASRWTWLLAQISDLEYRIRQHNELHHQIKKNKGAVAFEKSPTCTSATTTPTSSPVLPSSVNGYRGILPGNSKALDADGTSTSSTSGIAPNGAYDSSANNSGGSCRTRAFQRMGFRKRKLLQTANVHTVSKKAARPSTVKCGCQWPLHPCGLCTGRPDPTAPRDLPDTMTPSERVALLDSGFHSVLSFPEDVSHSIHFEATMRLPEWQNRVIRCSSKSASSSLKGAVAVHKAAEREDRSKKYVDSRRKYNRKYPQDIMAANKLKNAKARRSLHGGDQCNNHLVKSKHRKLVSSNLGGSSIAGGFNSGGGLSSTASSTAGSDSIGLIDSLDTSNGQFPRSKNASPTPGSHNSSSYKSERMDRRNRNSYDIDNIVIPYSVAAATRVEILPYKEIPTPKWRILDEPDSEFINSSLEEASKETMTISESASVEKTDTVTGVSECSDNTINPEKMEDAATQLEETHQTDEDETEDVSEEAIIIRHERALIEERKKFKTFLKYPWSTRSRANRRTDSRAESSGANTPDPSSPAPNTPSAGGDQESVPSPTAPSTPQTPLDTIDENISSNQGTTGTPNNQINTSTANSVARRGERKRTASGRKEREHSKDEMGGILTPDVREAFIPPYEPLEFPLADDVFEAMLQLMPNDHQILDECLQSDVVCDGSGTDKTNPIGGGGGEGKSNLTADNNHEYCKKNDSNISHNSTLGGGSSCNKGNSYTSDILTSFASNDNLIGEDSDTDSAESGIPDEDPNDPEWREPE